VSDIKTRLLNLFKYNFDNNCNQGEKKLLPQTKLNLLRDIGWDLGYNVYSAENRSYALKVINDLDASKLDPVIINKLNEKREVLRGSFNE
jgi:hypothetical protein